MEKRWCERLCFAASYSCMILEKSFISQGLHFMMILMMVMVVEENSYHTVREACARLLTSNILQETQMKFLANPILFNTHNNPIVVVMLSPFYR